MTFFSGSQSTERFEDREEAGRLIGGMLEKYGGEDVILLGLPRGGVPVAYAAAKVIDAPMDIFQVRKLGTPGHEELAMGAIASGGVKVLNDEVLRSINVSDEEIESVARKEQEELERRDQKYRGDRPMPRIEGRTVILVDDGLATGSSMRAVVKAIKTLNPAKIVVAVPVAAPEVCEQFTQIVDEVICVRTPTPFQAVGLWYENFGQTTDEEVTEILGKALSS